MEITSLVHDDTLAVDSAINNLLIDTLKTALKDREEFKLDNNLMGTFFLVMGATLVMRSEDQE
jgi:hypothetical protein